MNEQQLQNAIALIRTGARAMSAQEVDNAKAASILMTGEETVKLITEMAKPQEVESQP
jgi:hypothetical protein